MTIGLLLIAACACIAVDRPHLAAVPLLVLFFVH